MAQVALSLFLVLILGLRKPAALPGLGGVSLNQKKWAPRPFGALSCPVVSMPIICVHMCVSTCVSA